MTTIPEGKNEKPTLNEQDPRITSFISLVQGYIQQKSFIKCSETISDLSNYCSSHYLKGGELKDKRQIHSISLKDFLRLILLLRDIDANSQDINASKLKVSWPLRDLVVLFWSNCTILHQQIAQAIGTVKIVDVVQILSNLFHPRSESPNVQNLYLQNWQELIKECVTSTTPKIKIDDSTQTVFFEVAMICFFYLLEQIKLKEYDYDLQLLSTVEDQMVLFTMPYFNQPNDCEAIKRIRIYYRTIMGLLSAFNVRNRSEDENPCKYTFRKIKLVTTILKPINKTFISSDLSLFVVMLKRLGLLLSGSLQSKSSFPCANLITSILQLTKYYHECMPELMGKQSGNITMSDATDALYNINSLLSLRLGFSPENQTVELNLFIQMQAYILIILKQQSRSKPDSTPTINDKVYRVMSTCTAHSLSIDSLDSILPTLSKSAEVLQTFQFHCFNEFLLVPSSAIRSNDNLQVQRGLVGAILTYNCKLSVLNKWIPQFVQLYTEMTEKLSYNQSIDIDTKDLSDIIKIDASVKAISDFVGKSSSDSKALQTSDLFLILAWKLQSIYLQIVLYVHFKKDIQTPYEEMQRTLQAISDCRSKVTSVTSDGPSFAMHLVKSVACSLISLFYMTEDSNEKTMSTLSNIISIEKNAPMKETVDSMALVLQEIYSDWSNSYLYSCSNELSLSEPKDLFSKLFLFFKASRSKLSAQAKDVGTAEALKLEVESLLQEVVKSPYRRALEHEMIDAWVNLFAAKVTWLVHGHYSIALKFAKQARSYAHSGSSSSSSHACQSHIAKQVIRMESSLIIADLYEFCGRTSRSVDYIQEAATVLQVVDTPNCRGIWLLHAVRVYMRTESTRLKSLLLSFTTASNKCKSVSLSSPTLRFLSQSCEISKEMSTVLESLSLKSLLSVAPVSSGACSDALIYRDLNMIWGIKEEDYFNFKTTFYNCALPLQSKEKLQKLIGSGVDMSSDSICVVLDMEGFSFDYIRDIRRFLCTQSITAASKGDRHEDSEERFIHSRITSSKRSSSAGAARGCVRERDSFGYSREPPCIETTSFQSFLLGASSCFVSLRSNRSESDHSSLSSSTGGAQLISAAMAGDAKSCGFIENLLTQVFSQLIENHGYSSCSLCFVTFDQQSKCLLVGNYKGKGQDSRVSLISDGAEEIPCILNDWRAAMDDNHRSLHASKDAVTSKTLTDKQKKEWWKQRARVDSDIESILVRLEKLLEPAQHIFGGPCSSTLLVEGLLAEDSASARQENDSDDDEIDRLISTAIEHVHLDDDFSDEENAPANHSGPTATVDYEAMKVTELKELLKSQNLSQAGKKSELIERLTENDKLRSKASHSSSASSSRKHTKKPSLPPPPLSPCGLPNEAKSNKPHTILIVDEKLQGIPFESMPALRQQSISRIPSLSLLLDLLIDCSTDHNPSDCSSESRSSLLGCHALDAIDASRAWYALDVDNNLPDTRKLMQAAFDPYRLAWGWRGFVGEVPSEDIIRSCNKDSELYIYSGHGAGEQLHVFDSSSGSRAPASLLWGCSSGKLAQRGVHDPNGPILEYLGAGALFSIGNLWDVTDKDLDKLSIDCMKSFLPAEEEEENKQERPTIAQCLAKARESCKLKFAVGSAAVIYGIPLPASVANKM